MINYYLLTKPGIIIGNLFTVAAGFILASHGLKQYPLFFLTLIGLGFIIASACIFNNYIDREIDKKMSRTKNRAFAKGLVSGWKAIALANVLGLTGALVLFLYTNILTVLVAASGFFVYVLLYSLWKRHTIYGTAIGSIAGATPPVVGYCAISNQFDIGAVLLFVMLILWQMPHFFSIAVYHFDDYVKASIPVLPIKRGMQKTKERMIVYIISFIVVSGLLTVFHYTGYFFLIVTTLLGFAWLGLCLKGFKSSNEKRWARNMFRLSLVVITCMCIIIPFDLMPFDR